MSDRRLDPPTSSVVGSGSGALSRASFLRLGGVAAAGLGAAAAGLPTGAAPAQAAPGIPTVSGGLVVTQLGPVTGTGLTSQWQMAATDLGVSARTPDGRILTIFGDTFRDRVGGADWRSPVGLYTRYEANRAPWSTVRWDSAVGGGYARQLLPYDHVPARFGNFTILPADIITLGGTMYLWVMLNEGLHHVSSTEIYSSSDNGSSWRVHTMFRGDRMGGDSQYATWAYNHADDHVYLVTSRFDRSERGIYLQRVFGGSITDPGAYQTWGYRDGRWGWGNPATPIATGRFSEFQLRCLPGNKWVFTWQDDSNATIKVASLPNGPYSNFFEAVRTGRTIIRNAPRSSDGQGNLITAPYGPAILPGSTRESMHLFVSQWAGDLYRVRQVHVAGLT